MITKAFSLVIALLLAAGVSVQAESTAPLEPARSSKAADADEVDESTSEAVYSVIATGTVREPSVNVRGRPSFLGEVVAKLQKGDKVAILEEITRKNPAKGEPTNWFRIKLPEGTHVWVFSDYVSADGTVKARRLNFRGGPGENYSILGRVARGDVLTKVSTKGDWIQVEAPENAFAFVAANLIEKESSTEAAPAPVPEPAPAPEIVAAPEPLTPAEPVIEEPAPAPAVDESPAIAEPAVPVPTAPEPVEEIVTRRVVQREGIVRRSRNIQAPTYYELESIESGKLINYVHSPETLQEVPNSRKPQAVPDIDLEPYVGRRVIVTGEEFMDKRWKRTPVIEIEKIELQQ